LSFWLRVDEIAEDRESLDADPDWERRVVAPTLGQLLEEFIATIPPERLAELRAMDYRTGYLRTPEWRRTRRGAIFASGHRCQRCDQYKGVLDVHHLTYSRLGQEEPSDLIVLCRSCHRHQHEEG
jgi:5-methylcytosine-specific restriction endonuclease McrA